MKNTDYRTFFDNLERQGIRISEEKRRLVENKINNMLSYVPKVGVLGKTGVGKSSLCNALFGDKVATISDVEACTRNIQEILVGIGNKGIKLIDVPGVGESRERDKEYAALYSKLLPELDVVLWMLKADDRAFSSDEEFYKNVVKPHLQQEKPFFIILNQVDKIEPFREWNEEEHKPGLKQRDNMEKKIDSVADFFSFPKLKIIPVSANENFNLVELVELITHDLPNDKKYSFVKNVEKDKVSITTVNMAEKGFIDTVIEVIGGAVQKVRDVLQGGINFVRGLFNWW